MKGRLSIEELRLRAGSDLREAFDEETGVHFMTIFRLGEMWGEFGFSLEESLRAGGSFDMQCFYAYSGARLRIFHSADRLAKTLMEYGTADYFRRRGQMTEYDDIFYENLCGAELMELRCVIEYPGLDKPTKVVYEKVRAGQQNGV